MATNIRKAFVSPVAVARFLAENRIRNWYRVVGSGWEGRKLVLHLVWIAR